MVSKAAASLTAAPSEPEELFQELERDAGSVDEAEELTPIRFEEISSGPQIGEFGVEMRHPQDSSTPPASSTLESKDSSTPPVSSTLESSDSLGPQYWPSGPFSTSHAIGLRVFSDALRCVLKRRTFQGIARC